MVLDSSFFNRPTKLVAEDLLGKFLVKKSGKQIKAVMITGVEVYDGFRDRASHASRGITDRNSIMFGPPGYWYVYLVYGMHNMLNVVTREEGYPAAILIRSGNIFAERSRSATILDGPAKLTRYLGISSIYNRKQVKIESGLWIEDGGVAVPKSRIARAPRIGIEYAGKEWANKKLRFFII